MRASPSNILVIIAAALASACGVSYDSDPTQGGGVTPPPVTMPAGRDPFLDYDRPADFDSTVTESGVQVPVRVPGGEDSYIVCKIIHPAVGGVQAEGKFPTIISSYQAYHVLNAAAMPDYIVQRGYNVAICDPPGAGDSPGTVDQFGPISTQANYDLVEWLAVQSWSTDAIGQDGSSYGGHTTNMVAGYHPPHLKAIVPNSSFADWYEQTIYHGGIRNASILYQPVVVGATGAGGTNPTGGAQGNVENSFVDYTNHPLYDDFWRERSVMPRWSNYTIPALITDGWNDRYKDGTTKNYMARRENVWLLLGPWGHSSYSGRTAEGTVSAQNHQLAWYDHWLKNLPTAPLPRAKITSWEMPDLDGVTTGWYSFPDWPAGTRTTHLYFTPDKTLSLTNDGESAPLSWTVNAEDSGSDPAGGTAPSGVDQAERDNSAYRLTFTTAPLAGDVVLAGAFEAHLKVSFTATDGNLVARIMDVAPDGTVSQVCNGWLKASHYKGHDHLETIVPGEVYPMQVHVWPTHWRFVAGHSIRVSLSSGDVPDAVPDAPDGTVSVLTGLGGSYVDLPVLSGELL